MPEIAQPVAFKGKRPFKLRARCKGCRVRLWAVSGVVDCRNRYCESSVLNPKNEVKE